MKLKIGLVGLVIAVLLTGCLSTKPDNNTSGASTPEDAISSMFAALKAIDAPTFNSLVKYKQTKENGIVIETERFFGNSLDDDGNAYMLSVFEELNYKVLSSSDQTDKQKSFTLEITNKDLSNIDASDYVSSDNFLLAQANAIKGLTETVTNTIEVQVVYSEKSWQVIIDDNLRNALWGNKQETLDALSSLLS